MFNYRRVGRDTYTAIPGPTLSNLEPWLKAEGIPYRILNFWSDEVPEDLGESCVMQGREYTRHLYCVETDIEPEDLVDITEILTFGKGAHCLAKRGMNS